MPSSNHRKQRIERILRVREQQLRTQVAKLEQVARAAREAAQELAAAQATSTRAEEDRRRLVEQSAKVMTFSEANDWLLTTRARQALAARELHRQEVMLEKQRGAVNQSRTKLKQIERILEREAERTQAARSKRERSLEDEAAQRLARRRG